MYMLSKSMFLCFFGDMFSRIIVNSLNKHGLGSSVCQCENILVMSPMFLCF
jgi:hypothetical protein